MHTGSPVPPRRRAARRPAAGPVAGVRGRVSVQGPVHEGAVVIDLTDGGRLTVSCSRCGADAAVLVDPDGLARARALLAAHARCRAAQQA